MPMRAARGTAVARGVCSSHQCGYRRSVAISGCSRTSTAFDEGGGGGSAMICSLEGGGAGGSGGGDGDVLEDDIAHQPTAVRLP